MEVEEKVEEEKVEDPTKIDFRMTKSEWVIYWKVKYETSILRFQDAQKVIDAYKAATTTLQSELIASKKLLSTFTDDQIKAAQKAVESTSQMKAKDNQEKLAEQLGLKKA